MLWLCTHTLQHRSAAVTSTAAALPKKCAQDSQPTSAHLALATHSSIGGWELNPSAAGAELVNPGPGQAGSSLCYQAQHL